MKLLDDLGLRPLTPQEIKTASEKYISALRDGLAGQKSSLKMFRSCLSPVHLESLKEDSEALILEVGGTNLYGGRVRITHHKPTIASVFKTPIQKIVFTSAEEFFDTIISQLDPVISGKVPDAISLVYSFVGNPLNTPNGVDVMSDETLTKEFVVPGISHEGVGV